ncbi:hypothetical protein EJ03DRAFT_24547 [Teratosphaeria nubilosa]|uniref:Uncharacterized protein n=1 Tax=Teratosphaeria nubilosa TaxID=161662 RepID=A0A6G1LFV1_9PEZI|nr:hypothetical protein EJ03DRAFT_24547 [Teratosphaeria nubilosa]
MRQGSLRKKRLLLHCDGVFVFFFFVSNDVLYVSYRSMDNISGAMRKRRSIFPSTSSCDRSSMDSRASSSSSSSYLIIIIRDLSNSGLCNGAAILTWGLRSPAPSSKMLLARAFGKTTALAWPMSRPPPVCDEYCLGRSIKSELRRIDGWDFVVVVGDRGSMFETLRAGC